jgi:glycosyltransferase involved in cell wall biosynthesis
MTDNLDRNLKIFQIGKGWFPEEPGGLNRYFYDCSQALSNSGVEVSGMVTGSKEAFNISRNQIEAFSLPDEPILKRLHSARKVVKNKLSSTDVSLVVSHFSLYTFPALDILEKLPLVVHFHGPWALEGYAEGGKGLSVYFKKLVERSCYQRSVVFIVLSKAFQEILHREYEIPLEKIKIVPGGVNSEHFQPISSQLEARKKLGWETDRPVAVTVRRLSKRMGLENLIQAFSNMKEKHPDLLLKVVGKGALKSTLEQQIKDLGLGQHIELLGYISDEELPFIYRAADFSIVPTISLEGFGLTVIESLAAGTPVLGTPVGGIPEILHPLSSDLVLEGSAPEQLARGISEVLLEIRKLPSSEACQDYVRRCYSWTAITQHLKSIYTDAAEGMLR